MSKSFNVVIATAGRPTLQRMIDSIAPQLNEIDYLTIIWDCEPRELTINSNCQVIHIHNPEPLGYWGHGSRTRWQDELPGDYLMNGDDDDIYSPTAMETVRAHCTEHKLYFFQYSVQDMRVPREHVVAIGNVGTPTGVYPKLDNMPKWEFVYSGDGEFYTALSKRIPYEFIDKVIYMVRPESYREAIKAAVEVPEQILCICGATTNIEYNVMLRMYEGYCNRCDRTTRPQTKTDD